MFQELRPADFQSCLEHYLEGQLFPGQKGGSRQLQRWWSPWAGMDAICIPLGPGKWGILFEAHPYPIDWCLQRQGKFSSCKTFWASEEQIGTNSHDVPT